MYRSFLIIFLVLFSWFTAYAQEDAINVYKPSDYEAFKQRITNTNAIFLDKIDGKFSSKIKKVFKKRDEKIIEAIEDSMYFFNDTLRNSLNDILKNIYRSNPQISSDNYFFFIRNSAVPNAACYGDGNYELNLGLFSACKTDDELAFVICHEIAHLLLNHSIKNVTKRVVELNSDDTKKKIREIKRKKYGRTKAGLSLVDDLYIDLLDHSRAAEVEADSLGYILFNKTKYNKEASVSSLTRLKKVDDMIFSHNVKLDSVFSFETYPFKQFWLEQELSLFDREEKINDYQLVSDTITTHPEIKHRIEKLKSNFNVISSAATSNFSLGPISKMAVHQSIQYTIDLKLLDLSLYQLIEKFHNKSVDEDYYVITMATVLKRIYEEKKNHKLGKYIPGANNLSDEKVLNQIRLFLHNLELNEIKTLGLKFCESYYTKYNQNKDFESMFNFFKN